MPHTTHPDYETLASLLVDTASLPEEVRESSYKDANELIKLETDHTIGGDLHSLTLSAIARASEFMTDTAVTTGDAAEDQREAEIKAVTDQLQRILGTTAIEHSPEVITRKTSAGKKTKAKKRSNLSRTLARERRLHQALATEEMNPDMSDGWEEFHSGDVMLRPEVHNRARYVDIRLSNNTSRREHGLQNDVCIKYTKSNGAGSKVRLAGFDVPEDMRGAGLGLKLYDYFRRGLEVKGLKFDGTEVVRKPQIARLLMQAGLKPESTAIVAEILPREIWADGNTPAVVIRKGAEQEHNMRRDSNGGNYTFYDVVEAGDVPIDIEKVVPLHTRFVDRDTQNIPQTRIVRL